MHKHVDLGAATDLFELAYTREQGLSQMYESREKAPFGWAGQVESLCTEEFNDAGTFQLGATTAPKIFCGLFHRLYI